MKKASLLQVARLGGGYYYGYNSGIGFVNNYGQMINVFGPSNINLPAGVVIAPGATGVFARY